MTRDDLEQLDTKSLRALAKERFAKKARALRTRGALLAALTRTLPASAPRAASPGLPPRPSAPPGATVGHVPTSVAPRTAPAAARPSAAPSRVASDVAAEAPIEEGFFLGGSLPRPEPRRAPTPPSTTVGPPLPAPEARGRPPLGDEAPHLLARDATTLFLFWDFRRDLEHGAAFGLLEPRVHFRLYDGEAWVRTVEAPLGRRSLYLEKLEPGHLYSVEAWLAGSDGHARPTGRRSAAVRLARDVPSGRLEVAHARVPWEQPLREWRRETSSPSSESERLESPTRVELPASLDWRGGPGAGGPKSGRP